MKEEDKLLLTLNYTEKEERLTLGIENVHLSLTSLERITSESKYKKYEDFFFWLTLPHKCFRCSLCQSYII